MKNPKNQERKNFQGNHFEDFESDELVRMAAVAEHSIIRWTLEISDALDIPIDELASLRVRLKEFLDEEVY